MGGGSGPALLSPIAQPERSPGNGHTLPLCLVLSVGALSHGVSGRHYESEEEYIDPLSAGKGKCQSAKMDLGAGF